MKKIYLGSSTLEVPQIAVGCMRLNALDEKEIEAYILGCVESGATFFDHADIYGGGTCETLFGKVLKKHPALREKLFLQSKCGIVPGKMYDASKEAILRSVEGILERLHTDHLEMLLLHRPDALIEPEEVAEAFATLKSQGKVLHFGVSNQNPMQMALLQKYVEVPLLVNQLQLSLPVSQMIASGLEVNMTTEGAVNRDGSVLDYCRLQEVTVQAWSPFQKPDWGGLFLEDEAYGELNAVLQEIAESYGATKTMIAAAWILRHPAKIQLISGTTRLERMQEIIEATKIHLTREEWYRLYLAAGHILP